MNPRSFLERHRLNLCLAAGSVLVALLLGEIGYRAYLLAKIAASRRESLTFSVADKVYWQYDEALGYRYIPNTSANLCAIQDGLPVRADTVQFDRRGNSGREDSDAAGDVRIFILGDSFTMIQHDGVTWPDLLQKNLRAATGHRISVVNYAREGYGVLQMVDQASALIDEKPDMILICFVSFDLPRARFWRMVRETPEGVDLFTSTSPSLQLEKPETYARSLLVNPLATRQWCERMIVKRDRGDPTLKSVLDSYVTARNNHQITRFNPFSLRKAYLWQRLTNPRILAGGSANPHFTYEDFTEDSRFVREIERLRRSRIPVSLIHLPWRPELSSRMFIMGTQGDSLLKSLTTASGFPLIEMLPPQPLGKKADLLTIGPGDSHPSLMGLNYYAAAVAKALLASRSLK